ncbi:MAG: hypothetical protein WCH07_03255 [Deltaproteobacteria bacterium]
MGDLFRAGFDAYWSVASLRAFTWGILWYIPLWLCTVVCANWFWGEHKDLLVWCRKCCALALTIHFFIMIVLGYNENIYMAIYEAPIDAEFPLLFLKYVPFLALLFTDAILAVVWFMWQEQIIITSSKKLQGLPN